MTRIVVKTKKVASERVLNKVISLGNSVHHDHFP